MGGVNESSLMFQVTHPNVHVKNKRPTSMPTEQLELLFFLSIRRLDSDLHNVNPHSEMDRMMRLE